MWIETLTYWLLRIVIVWAVCAFSVSGFYGAFMLFKLGYLSGGEVFDRVCDGRCFRDVLLWPIYVAPLLLGGLLLTCVVYPIVFTLRRRQILAVRGYQPPHQGR